MATCKRADTPEYIINQSTLTCLAVLSGHGANDAVIGMAKCSGNINQQWYFIHGKLLWGGNRSLCLAQDNRKNCLCLQSCSTATGLWILDEKNRLVFDSNALDVPWQSPRTKVMLYPKHEGSNQKWWTLSQLRTHLEQCSPKLELESQNVCPCQDVSDFMVVSSTGDIVDGDQSAASPEFLINRSTLTCLTVLNGTDLNNATIGLSPFKGDLNQQWFVNGKRWHWGGNRSYCLEPNWNGGLSLVKASHGNTSWNLDNEGIFEAMGKVLDVPWEKPRTHVILYPKHGGENQKWWKLSDVRSALQKSSASNCNFPNILVKMTEQIPEKMTNCGCKRKDKDLTKTPVNGEPMFLISQSTHTCLSVLSGTNPADAVIGLAQYTGDVKQQWFVKNGQWQWGGNRAFYLTADHKHGKLSLSPSNDLTCVWVHDQEGLLSNGPHALDVPWQGDRKKVILYPKHGGVNQKWLLRSSNVKCVEPKLYPFPANDENLYQQEVARGIVNQLCPLSDTLPFPRDVSHYPGTVPPGTPRINLSCTLNVGTVRQAKNLRMTVPEDWQATNMYVVAGDVFKIILPDTLTEKQAKQITARVGAQCDCLDPTSPNLKNAHFKRMPVVSEEFEVYPGINTLRSQYGGNLIFTYEGELSFQVLSEIQNVVEAPHYILGKTRNSDWEKMKTMAAPFAILETNKVVLVAPTKEAKGISDLDVLLYQYNNILEKLEDLSGFSACDPPPQGKQWLVDDVQISAGSAHAGFPAMFDHQYYDLTSPETPNDWVVWHELGHNYQQADYWSYAYGSESTVNLFSLYIEEKLIADDRLKRENKYLETAELVDNGMTFEKADCWQKLVFLMEIKHAFPNHGWDMFRHLNRTTRALSEAEASVLSSSQQKQYDYVYKTLSRYVGADLLPHYQRWGLTISEQAKKDVRAAQFPNAPENLSAKAHPDQCIIA